jgi:hypothetical protein
MYDEGITTAVTSSSQLSISSGVNMLPGHHPFHERRYELLSSFKEEPPGGLTLADVLSGALQPMNGKY